MYAFSCQLVYLLGKSVMAEGSQALALYNTKEKEI